MDRAEEISTFVSRMINWKFYQAEAAIPADLEEDQRIVVTALAETFGNCGWFDGKMGLIVGAAVDSVVREVL